MRAELAQVAAERDQLATKQGEAIVSTDVPTLESEVQRLQDELASAMAAGDPDQYQAKAAEHA